MLREEYLESLENEDMKIFAKELLNTIPEYWYSVPASSTGKYHPQYALGDGGLMRHSIAVLRFVNHIFATNIFNFSSRERDILRIAAIMHDTRKSGSQEDYKNNKYTRFEHPLLAAEVIRSYKSKGFINDDEIEIMANAIESHMGQWNTDKRSGIVLPIPSNKYQKLLHLADYLASRKDIEMRFENP